MKKLNKQNGITLIALVITIIVMLILVAVTINMAINGGLFEKAGQAAQKYQGEQENESNIGKITIGGVEYNSIDDYIAKNNGTSQDVVKWVYVDNGDGTVEITGIDLRGKKSEKRTIINQEAGQEYGAITLKLANDTLAIPGEIDGKKVAKVSFVENIYDGMLESDNGWFAISGVKSIIFSDSIETIGGQTISFEDVENLHLPSELKEIQSVDAWSKPPMAYLKKVQTITIPQNVEGIGEYAFYKCESLKNIVFEGTPKSIGNDVFHGCDLVNELTIPEGVEKIGNSLLATYEGTEPLTINLPKTLKEFGGLMSSRSVTLNFQNGKNENLTIPEDKWFASKIIIEGVEQ